MSTLKLHVAVQLVSIRVGVSGKTLDVVKNIKPYIEIPSQRTPFCFLLFYWVVWYQEVEIAPFVLKNCIYLAL
jgi:hypothetical protein